MLTGIDDADWTMSMPSFLAARQDRLHVRMIGFGSMSWPRAKPATTLTNQ